MFGIPDFRLRPDAYLSLDDERAKAARLEAFGKNSTFSELLDHYYAITPDVPPKLAPVFAGYVQDAPTRSKAALTRLGDDPAGGIFLDLGCGSGGALLAASGRYSSCAGVDIAMRWLVLARKRLTEAGVEAHLVCADAEALPFAPDRFSHVLAEDLIDNVGSPEAVLRMAAQVLQPGGRLWLSAANRRWIGPHPATGVWAAGLTPQRWRAARLTRKHGFDLLRAVTLHTPAALARLADRAGLRIEWAGPRHVNPSAMHGRSSVVRMLATVYRALVRTPVACFLLTRLGPAFEMSIVKPPTNCGA